MLADTMLDRAELHDILEDIIADNKRAAAIIKRLREALNEARADVKAMEEGCHRESSAGDRLHRG